MGRSRPAASAWAPFGLRTRQARSLVSSGRSWRRWFKSRTEASARSKVIIGLLQAPGIDDGGLGLPDGRILDTWEIGKAAELGRHGNPIVGLGKHGGLAGNAVAQDGKAIPRSHGEGVKAVE